MNNASSTGTSTWGTISGHAQLRLAGLLVLLVAAVALTVYATAAQPGTPAMGKSAAAAAANQPQAAPAGQVRPNAAQASPAPNSSDHGTQDYLVRPASPLERLYLRQQLKLDMCEGSCGR